MIILQFLSSARRPKRCGTLALRPSLFSVIFRLCMSTLEVRSYIDVYSICTYTSKDLKDSEVTCNYPYMYTWSLWVVCCSRYIGVHMYEL